MFMPDAAYPLSNYGTTVEELNASLLVGQRVTLGREATFDDWMALGMLDKISLLPPAEEFDKEAAMSKVREALLSVLSGDTSDTSAEEAGCTEVVSWYEPVQFVSTGMITDFVLEEGALYAAFAGYETIDEFEGEPGPLQVPMVGRNLYRITD